MLKELGNGNNRQKFVNFWRMDRESNSLDLLVHRLDTESSQNVPSNEHGVCLFQKTSFS